MSFYEREEGAEVFVEETGSVDKCVYCDRPATRVVFLWPERLRCLKVFVCEEHWISKMKRLMSAVDFVNMGFQELGGAQPLKENTEQR